MTNPANKIVFVLDTLLNAVVIIIGAIILFVSCYSIMDNMRQYQGASDSSILAYRPALEEPISDEAFISEHQAAWIYISGTNIDFPIMQGADNYEYLNKDPYGEFRLSGSIFLDYRNDRNLNDEYSVVYGHHMEHGAMFGSLDAFEDRAYFDEHKTGWIATGEAVYGLELFAVCSANAVNQTLFNPQGRTISEVTDFLRENAVIYTEPEEGRRVVALSTCSGDSSMMRLLVFGAIIEQ